MINRRELMSGMLGLALLPVVSKLPVPKWPIERVGDYLVYSQGYYTLSDIEIIWNEPYEEFSELRREIKGGKTNEVSLGVRNSKKVGYMDLKLFGLVTGDYDTIYHFKIVRA